MIPVLRNRDLAWMLVKEYGPVVLVMALLASLVVMLFAQATFVTRTVDLDDGVPCSVYRVGKTEVNICRVDGGQ